MFEDTTSAAFAAAVRPESALERLPEMLMTRYRLMFVVSCNISSTVWITLAFDE